MADELRRRIGLQVQVARRRTGLSQEVLANRVRRSTESISNIERGRQLPSLETLFALGEALDVPIMEFFRGLEPSGRRRNSPARARLEVELAEVARGLDDKILAIAIEQIKQLTAMPRFK